MALGPVRVSIPEEAKQGEIIDIKTLIQHPMETGYRVNAIGEPIPRNIIQLLTVTYSGEEIFRMDLTQGVAANPFIAFSTLATESGELVFKWEDNRGEAVTLTKMLKVTG